MPLTYLASYPNSRVKPRPATREETQFQLYAPESGVDVPTTVLPGIGSDPGRIVNANDNVEVLPANGDRTFLYVRNTSLSKKLYICTRDVANIEVEGISLKPTEGYDVEETSQPLYVKSEAGERIIVEVNYGIG